jgi:hypothetical protein
MYNSLLICAFLLKSITMSVEEIGNAFVNHFYATLDSNPMGLASLYQPGSTLTAQGQTFVGAENIIGKYMVSLI